jgi:general secretion pathway protein J
MRKTRGFTLIELLVTVAITAMVFAMISGILFSVLDATERVEVKMRSEKMGYGCLQLLRRDLEGAYAYAVGTPCFKGEKATEAAHDANRFWLLACASGPPDEKGKRSHFDRVAYRLKAMEDSKLGLYRRSTPWVPGEDPLGGGEFTLICGGLQSLKLSYFDEKEKRWIDGDWKETDRVPRAVKIELELARDREAEEAAQAAGVDLPKLKFESVVGIAARADLDAAKPAGP